MIAGVVCGTPAQVQKGGLHCPPFCFSGGQFRNVRLAATANAAYVGGTSGAFR
jgi:hypothetical protein